MHCRGEVKGADLAPAYAQHDLPEYMSLPEPFVGRRGALKWIRSRDRNPQARLLDRPSETFELSNAGRRVIRHDPAAASLFGRRLDTVRKRNPPATFERVK
jgi:hypothetical protein